jgi:hypothetical protein
MIERDDVREPIIFGAPHIEVRQRTFHAFEFHVITRLELAGHTRPSTLLRASRLQEPLAAADDLR